MGTHGYSAQGKVLPIAARPNKQWRRPSGSANELVDPSEPLMNIMFVHAASEPLMNIIFVHAPPKGAASARALLGEQEFLAATEGTVA